MFARPFECERKRTAWQVAFLGLYDPARSARCRACTNARSAAPRGRAGFGSAAAVPAADIDGAFPVRPQRAVLFVRHTHDARGRDGLGRPPVTPASATGSARPKCAGYAVSSRPPERDQPCSPRHCAAHCDAVRGIGVTPIVMAGPRPIGEHSEIDRRTGPSFVMAELGSAIHDFVRCVTPRPVD